MCTFGFVETIIFFFGVSQGKIFKVDFEGKILSEALKFDLFHLGAGKFGRKASP